MEEKVLLRIHPSLRNSLALIVWPIVGIFVINFVIKRYIWEEMTFLPMLIIGLVLLLFPAWAWFRTRFLTFVVLENAVYAREGLVSRFTNEIRIVDIRAINVRQGLFQRMMNVGDMGFSSAAGDKEEVTFRGVRNPEGIKKLVQGQMPRKRDEDDGE